LDWNGPSASCATSRGIGAGV